MTDRELRLRCLELAYRHLERNARGSVVGSFPSSITPADVIELADDYLTYVSRRAEPDLSNLGDHSSSALGR